MWSWWIRIWQHSRVFQLPKSKLFRPFVRKLQLPPLRRGREVAKLPSQATLAKSDFGTTAVNPISRAVLQRQRDFSTGTVPATEHCTKIHTRLSRNRRTKPVLNPITNSNEINRETLWWHKIRVLPSYNTRTSSDGGFEGALF